MTKPVLLTVRVSSLRRATCSACGAALTFGQLHGSGRWHPFNADPTLGRIYRDPEGPGHLTEISSEWSHFSSCPRANDFRRRGGAAGRR